MKKILICIFGFIFLVFAAGIFLFSYYFSSLNAVDIESSEQKIFTITSGERAKEIAQKLKDKKFIINDFTFLINLYLENKQNTIQSGDYLLAQNMSVNKIIEIITSGKTSARKLTIVEGWTLKDIALELEKIELANAEEFYKITGAPAMDYSNKVSKPKDFSKEFTFLSDKPQSLGLEGYLYPDTYYLTSEDSIENIIKKSLKNFDEKLTQELKNEIKKQGKSVFEIVTIASIIEKEVKGTSDRKMVSGVIQNRMKIGMALQIDATTLYGQSDGTKIDNKKDSPYNTYLNRGLPLGPICNPSIDSIMAAIYPTANNYLFYLSARDGTTIFSKTFEEHKRAQQHL
ncbi:MAG: endolytic transglycosylase MltG [Candidatus Pacebacteria bacterium]|nr:endolytic transglycosylase MltG [Candidatus Paceibacterota bacterium]